VTALRRAFGGSPPTEEELALTRQTVEIERMLGYFDDNILVASAGIISYEMTVPGGALLPCGGVTMVSVASTHRRRGLLRSIMRRQLDDMHERGEPLAALYASEATIYGRFGYGLATYEAQLEIDRSRSAFTASATSTARLSMLEASAAMKTFPQVWDAALRQQPGMLRLEERSWRHELADLEHHRRGSSPFYHVLCEVDGHPSGLALYRIKMDWGPSGPRGKLQLKLLIAANSAAYASLWRHVLDVDLITTISADMRPLEEPLRFLFADPRQPSTSFGDGIWLRLVDVGRALTGRRYSTSDHLVIRMHDDFCSWNQGTFELEGGPDAASCRSSNKPPDLEVGAADLAAVYLGGNRFSVLQDAGRVIEHQPHAVSRADAMFAAERVPWCPSHF
jgi:predicted acetyltransferase